MKKTMSSVELPSARILRSLPCPKGPPEDAAATIQGGSANGLGGSPGSTDQKETVGSELGNAGTNDVFVANWKNTLKAGAAQAGMGINGDRSPRRAVRMRKTLWTRVLMLLPGMIGDNRRAVSMSTFLPQLSREAAGVGPD